MQVRSLGYRTDLIFSTFNGEVLDRGDYLVIRTPSNPTFYWGNFLLFSRPPESGDFERWQVLFAEEIGAGPEIRHMTFGWDTTLDEVGVCEPFLEAGFELAHQTVLTAQRLVAPPPPAQAVSIRPLRSDEDWLQAVENQVRCREGGHEEAGYRVFKRRQMASYRKMVEAGWGEWFGAFLGEMLVADLGLFHTQDLGRYQSVGTHPDFRRRGIAANLVFQAGRHGQSHFGIDRLVIVADHESAASRLYRSLGFNPEEHQMGLERWW